MISTLKKFRADLGILWHAERLARRAANLSDPESWLRAVSGVPAFCPIQKATEIVGLLKLLEREPPRVVCEIGTAGGGSLFLFTRVAAEDALLVTYDIAISRLHSLAIGRFGRSRQRVISRCLNSQAPDSVERTQQTLGGRPIDLLYIDGDHSYEGVRSDFERYSPLVRPGGLIVLHDIVPDARSRGMTPSNANSGGVPVLWRELASRFNDRQEFVQDWNQEGCGIGVMRVPVAV